MTEPNWQDTEDAWHWENRLRQAWAEFKKKGATSLTCERCRKPIVFTRVEAAHTRAACPCSASDRERCETLGKPE